jgi:acylglycerol lipase
MGGCLAAHYGLLRPQDIDGIVFNSAALMVSKSISSIRKFACRVLGNYTPDLKVGYLKFSHNMTSVAEEIEIYENDKLIHHGKVDAGTGLGLLKANEEFEGKMELFEVPFLALQGTSDELVDPDGPKRLHSLAPVTDKTLKVFEGAKHDLLHERIKKEVTETITDWLLVRAKK